MTKRILIALILVFAIALTGCNGGADNNIEDSSNAEAVNDIIGNSVDGTAEESDYVSQGQHESEQSPDVEETPEASLESLKATYLAEGCKIAVAYVGFCDGDYGDVIQYLTDTGVCSEFPFLQSITEQDYYTLAGSQLFVIVPLTKGSKVLVSNYIMDENFKATCRLVMTGREDMPVLIRGNYSDAFPNLYVSASLNDAITVEYKPFLSLENGKLYVPDSQNGVCDFSPYELLGIGNDEWSEGYPEA